MIEEALTEFRQQIIERMLENPPRIVQCLGLLTEDEIWSRPNSSSNSIANLILHLSGNIRQYIIASLGGQPDTRNRSAEFEAMSGFNRNQLVGLISSTVTEAVHVIRKTPDEELMRKRLVQGFEMSGIGICIHVCEHLSYHTGQIAFRTKQLRDTDLKFYGDMDLDILNAS